MKVLITGFSGLIGTALAGHLTKRGHSVVGLSRTAGDGVVVWDPEKRMIDEAGLVGIEAVVHLAGAGVASGRWTAARKKEIVDSRVGATRLLVDALGRMDRPPSVLVSASGSGFYGETGDRVADEDARQGQGFLAELCRQWEAEAIRASEFGIRVVCLRTGVVLTPNGGALGRLLPIFKAFLGGPAGNGSQWMSWISIDDHLAIIEHMLARTEWNGPVNAVSPTPVRNALFSSELGRVLGKPSAFPVPAFVLKLLFGEMARETILASSRLRPRRLVDSGFQFQHPTVTKALEHLLG